MSNMLWISLLSIFCIFFHVSRQRKPFSPGVVHGVLWLLIGLGYALALGEAGMVSTRALSIMLTGIAAFSLGIHLGAGISAPIAVPQTAHRAVSVSMPAVIVVVSAIGLAMMLNRAFEYMPPSQATSWFGGAGSWYAGLRNNLNAQWKGSFGLAGYVLNFSFAGTVYLILRAKRIRGDAWLWLSVAMSLGFAFLSTGRTHLVLLGCMIIGAAMPTSRRKRLVLALLIPLAAGATLFLVTLLAGRLTTTSSETLIASLVNTQLKGYILTAVGAFDIFVNSDLPGTGGRMTFRTPLAVLQFLGFPIDVPDVLQPNVTFASFLINVYTVFYPYYRDFGVIGIGLFMVSLGTLHGWVFSQLKTGLPIFIVANSLLFYALLMQFFQDQYFSLMSQWVQILGWTYVFTKLQPLPGIPPKQSRQ